MTDKKPPAKTDPTEGAREAVEDELKRRGDRKAGKPREEEIPGKSRPSQPDPAEGDRDDIETELNRRGDKGQDRKR